MLPFNAKHFIGPAVSPIPDIVNKSNSNNNNNNNNTNDFWTAALAGDRQWSEQQAQKQMDFQREMSNTSWQRGVQDMQKAGLNPALAYSQGGASSAGGAMASTSSTQQSAELQRERMLFSLLNTAISTLPKLIR